MAFTKYPIYFDKEMYEEKIANSSDSASKRWNLLGYLVYRNVLIDYGEEILDDYEYRIQEVNDSLKNRLKRKRKKS